MVVDPGTFEEWC